MITKPNITSKRITRAAIALAALSALTLSACGSDGSSTTDAPTTEVAADTAAPAAPDTAAPDTAATDTAAPDATDGAEAGAAGAGAVTIAKFAYDPDALEVAAGTEVTWTNEDGFAHTVTNDGGDTEFDSGNLAEGETYSMTFDEPGEYSYLCTIHTQMKATVIVS